MPLYQKELRYIKNYWKKIIRFQPRDTETHIGLPYRFIVPNHKMFPEMYYWDSFFIIKGLLAAKKYSLVLNIVNDFLYLVKRFGIIPNATRFYFLSHSQPPFLSSMVLDAYKINKDKKWLRRAYALIKKEYENIWMGDFDKKIPIKTKIGLSRYFDINYFHSMAEACSGWDMTPRFEKRCLDVIPCDLNFLLFKYEKDLEHISRELDLGEERKWRRAQTLRRGLINKYLWDNKKKFFFDYDMKYKRKINIYSLAPYFALWSGFCDKKQACDLFLKLKRFEAEYGLLTCDKDYGAPEYQQWNYPNGWPPLQYIVTEGLKKYSYDKKAKESEERWLRLCSKIFAKTGKFWEKYDVIEGKVAKDERYPTQEGFGWTNAVFLIFYQDLYMRY
jgi:alpha,alpha-trehalase